MIIFLTALGLVLIAEMGDKTQLVAMAFATRYKPWKVMVGVLAAVSVLNLMAVILGSYIVSYVPLSVIRTVAALIFLAFGLFNLKEGNDDDKERTFKFGEVLTVALTFFIGELGDKTQLMTITLAAQYDSPYMVFLGSTAGMLLADGLGVIVGSTIFKKIPQRVVKIVSSCVFIFFGAMGLYNSLPNQYVSPFSILTFLMLMSGAIFAIYRYNQRRRSELQSESDC